MSTWLFMRVNRLAVEASGEILFYRALSSWIACLGRSCVVGAMSEHRFEAHTSFLSKCQAQC